MKLTYTTIAALLIGTTAMATPPNGNGPCTTGNAVFCGVQGEPGPAGPQGEQGAAGPQGETGAQGPAGADGATGPQGPAGANGADGKDGKDGRDGADGIDGLNGADGKDGTNGRDGQDFSAAGHAASLAASTALGGLQFQSLSAGQTGWAAGIGGQFDGDAALAIGINHGLTDTISVNASIASTFDGNGVSAFIGASGRF